jgi:hypothetical protein
VTTREIEELCGFAVPKTFEMVMVPDGRIFTRVDDDWREAEVEMVEQEHRYLSTACLHEVHSQCRKRCKFCDARCRCSCHQGER